MITIEVNNKKVDAKEGEFLLAALRRTGVKIPTLCNMEGLLPSGACRMCVVEIEGMPGLVPSCAFPVYEGMKVKTHSDKVFRARKTILELLLASHPDDCLYCARNGKCELQDLSRDMGVNDHRFFGEKNLYYKDTSSPSLVRDPAKCILCGKCVRVCEEFQGVSAIDFIGRGSKTYVGPAFNEGLNISSCINCGQCIVHCPTGALTEHDHISEVMAAIHDPEKVVVVQHAPSISVTIGEEFGVKAGNDMAGILTSAFRKLGFDKVFDTSFSADLTIMEEATELVHRIKNGGKLPMITSCSPGWIKFMEEFYPELSDNLSTCKSPQQMMGAVIKSYYAERQNIRPENIYSVSIMPCTAKKFEASRPEMANNGIPDVDAVLTTRELAKLIRMKGIDFNSLGTDYADNPFGERSTAGKIFGATGGVMEAAVRTAHYLITGVDMEQNPFADVRGLEGRKEAKIKVGGLELGIAVVSGLANARKLLDEIKKGRNDIHFIEIMSCPGGCINGGGQPIGINMDNVVSRMKALYKIDKEETLWASHKNKSIIRLYEEYLGEPNGHKSHKLLHTHYHKREVLL